MSLFHFSATIDCLLSSSWQLNVPISLRLLALILCSNCSINSDKLIWHIVPYLLDYFLTWGGSLVLAQYPPRMVLAFHAPP